MGWSTGVRLLCTPTQADRLSGLPSILSKRYRSFTAASTKLCNVRSFILDAKISPSLSYVTVRGRWKGQGDQYAICAIAWRSSLLPRTSAGWPQTCVFVTVNEARRYLAASTFTFLSHHVNWSLYFTDVRMGCTEEYEVLPVRHCAVVKKRTITRMRLL
jgi:hypothetical protein